MFVLICRADECIGMAYLFTTFASFRDGQTHARKAYFSTTDQDGHRFRVVHRREPLSPQNRSYPGNILRARPNRRALCPRNGAVLRSKSQFSSLDKIILARVNRASICTANGPYAQRRCALKAILRQSVKNPAMSIFDEPSQCSTGTNSGITTAHRQDSRR